VAALLHAVNRVIQRHEVLRTRFDGNTATPRQIIQPTEPRVFSVLDLSGLAESARRQHLSTLIESFAAAPFDLARGPVLRLMIVRLESRNHALLSCMHHIACDAWSLAVWQRELAALYQPRQNAATALPALPVQYADYAFRQRQWWQDGDGSSHLADFWREELAGAPALLELPTDRPRPAAQTFNGALAHFHLEPELIAAFEDHCLSLRATPFMGWLAAFGALMHRYSGQADVVLGSPVANRDRAELEPLIGLFLNTLALRGHFHHHSSFNDQVAQSKDTMTRALARAALPFEHMVEILQPERSLSHAPIFQVMLVVQPPHAGDHGLDGLHLQPLETRQITAKFDLTLFLNGAQAAFEYNTDLFDEPTVQRMARHFQRLLRAIVAAPAAPLARIELLDADERRRALHELNQTEREHAHDLCLHQLFETRARQTPERIAAVGDGALTYQGLERAANRLAHHLIQLGCRRETSVAICLEPSLDMVVAVLAVLKSGATVLPLDPTYPVAQMTQRLNDAGSAVLISQPDFADWLPQHAGTTLYPAQDAARIAARSSQPPAVAVSADQLFYTIYTSGSTGRPKGIALPHRALVNLIHWYRDNLGQGGKILQFASLGFDISFLELFYALDGGCIQLVPETLRLDPPKLLDFVARQCVNKIILPVVVLQMWAETRASRPELFRHVEHIVTAGEQLQVNRQVVELFSHLPDTRLHNHYGPAETHVVTAFSPNGTADTWAYRAPIGRPIDNCTSYILDRHLQAVPTNVTGHLFLGGRQLARGYLGKPALTAARFIPDPHGDRPGARLYDTGDLARLPADGQIVFLGRRDHMVKIRGFRVEPGEVEHALDSLEQVQHPAVIARGHGADKHLVAYFVAAEPLDHAHLRAEMEKRLPHYMVPGAFVQLDEMPLNASRKIDRRRLPDPPAPQTETYRPPRNEVETILCDIFGQVLGVERVGIDDSFFILGGHSLTATQLVNQIERRFDLTLPLRELFITPTPAGVFDAMAKQLGDRDMLLEMGRMLMSMEELSEDELNQMIDQMQQSPEGVLT
jgi:amino acid adenylation domain-containing protein